MTQDPFKGLTSDLERAVVVVGAGGHAKVAIEALRHSGYRVIGCTDFDTTRRSVVGVNVLGGDEQLPEIRRTGVRFAFPAIGNNGIREEKGAELVALGFELPAAVGPSAILSPSAQIGRGVALFGGAVVNADARIEDFAIINTNASVDHDCRIGRAVHVAPGCSIAGCVQIGDRTFLGAGTSVIPSIMIGSDVLIGAGSVVIRNLPDGVTAVGAPARILEKQS